MPRTTKLDHLLDGVLDWTDQLQSEVVDYLYPRCTIGHIFLFADVTGHEELADGALYYSVNLPRLDSYGISLLGAETRIAAGPVTLRSLQAHSLELNFSIGLGISLGPVTTYSPTGLVAQNSSGRN
jgi:hypothetical protein